VYRRTRNVCRGGHTLRTANAILALVAAVAGLAACVPADRPPVTNELPRYEPPEQRPVSPPDSDPDRRPPRPGPVEAPGAGYEAGDPGSGYTGGGATADADDPDRRRSGRCDPAAADFAIGRYPDPRVVDEAVAATGARSVRVVPFGGAATMDFSETRLTIDLDRSGRIARLTCG
jgi:hypothetical protein